MPELRDAVGGVQPRAREVHGDAVVDQVLGRGLRPRPQAGAGDVRVGEVGDRLLHGARGDQADPSPSRRAQVRERRRSTSRIEVSRFAFRAAASMPSSSTSSARAWGGPPAFATRTSSAPNRSSVASTRRAGVAGSVTSAAIASDSPAAEAAVGLPEPCLVAGADQDHARPLRARALGGAPSEPLGRGRHQGDLPLESQVHAVHVRAWRRRLMADRVDAPSAPTAVALVVRPRRGVLVGARRPSARRRRPAPSRSMRADPERRTVPGPGGVGGHLRRAGVGRPAGGGRPTWRPTGFARCTCRPPTPIDPAFVYPAGVAAFVDAAHDAGRRVVAWYLPGLT